MSATCPHHGSYTSRDGACPTCRDVQAARAVLRSANGCSAAYRRARELLEDLGERVDDGAADGSMVKPEQAAA